MSLEEARRVLWLRTYPRPLGELYDSGYLNRGRLEWAVAKAYDPKLKRAALEMLKQLQPAADQPPEEAPENVPAELPQAAAPIGLTLEQVRATRWPFRPFKGQPMGKLIETKQITLKQLAYLAENSWNERERQAATALMLVRLNQKVKEPAPPAGFMKVVSGGRSFAEHKQLQITLLEGAILGGLMGLMIAYCIYLFTRAPSTQPSMTLPELAKSPLGLAVLVVLVAIIGLVVLGFFILDRVLKKMDKDIENYHLGQIGEDKVVEVILQTLDGNWSLFRNLQLPGRSRADLDAVLVGPSGVWVFEIKNLSGVYRNTGEQWEYRAGQKWNPYGKSPSRQAHTGAARLGNFLKADGLKQWVEAVVVWADQESPLLVENPSVAVWPLERLPDELGNLWQEEKVSPDVRLRIVEKLTKLCERQEEEKKKG
jgi:hypothetical protein